MSREMDDVLAGETNVKEIVEEKEIDTEEITIDKIDAEEIVETAEEKFDKAKKAKNTAEKALRINNAKQNKKEESNLIILFEDNHIIVVLKPQNVPSQEDSSGDKDMLNMVKDYIKVKYDKPGNVFVGLVHRLDRPTGGIMVFAKTSKAAARLAEQMQTGDFDKRYFAITVGTPREKQARLVDFLVKDEKNNIVKRYPSKVEDSKKAELDYKVLQSTSQIALLDIHLITGRSHQARVQLATIGTPIFGDAKYGGDALAKGHNLALFSYQLSFLHPITKENMVFKVFPPTDIVPWKYFAIEKHMNIVKPQ